MGAFERSGFGQMCAGILRVKLMLYEGGQYLHGTKRLTVPLMKKF